MKTTIEVPDELFRQAKAQAALQGISLQELFIQGLQLAMQKPAPGTEGQRAQFPIIIGTRRSEPLTNEQVAAALEQMAQEETAHDASFV